ncbi:Cell pattern formation-associated protein stuA [Ceratocystis lukuohia]|uniref:Cell pattern formation-associated protein stuA n=1 Tax=Ceratocystis lukuohia TaxID=2019550 RepID=A0ABR4MAT2_9PEZI
MSQGDMYYQPIPGSQQAPQGPPNMAHYQTTPSSLIHSATPQYPPPYSHQYYATMPSQGHGSMHGTMGTVLPPPVSGVPSHGPIHGHAQAVHGHYPPTTMDTTGQIAPPGMKPRVTATLWEDEGSVCFQVEAKGICVARREDDNMINGTKLLNVAGMTRGRRDGILKSEKQRRVVKIGPMHLKGVWIPYERALDFANKEKITELLYPLFVHQISTLLCHPANSTRTNQVLAAHERRKQEHSLSQGLPALHHQPQLALPAPAQPLASHATMTRPALDRGQTFPTPPATAGSVMGGIGSTEGFQWSQQAQGTHSMIMDPNVHNRSIPTPATTPPGGAMGPMQAYSQTPSGQHYDSRPPMYNAASSQQSPYQNSAPMPQERVYQGSYVKTEMAPPASRSGSIVEVEQQEKAGAGIMPSDQSNQVVPHGEPEPEADHENEYTHDSTYDNRNAPQYNYPAPTPVAPMPETQIPSDTGSPSHGNNGRATPRTTNSHTFYQPPSTVSYPTSPRNMSSNNVFHVINNDRNNSGAATPDNETFPKIEMSKGYTPQPPVGNNNGGSAGIKRSLDDDEEAVPDIKRRKTELSADGNASSGYDSVSRPNGVAVPRRR